MKKYKIGIAIIILILIITGVLYLKYKIEDNRLRSNIKEYDVLVYTEAYLSDLLPYNIINNKKINTNVLGSKVVKCFYEDNKNKKQKIYIKINIVDKTPPLVWLNDSYSVVLGSKDNLKDTIFCGDNYDKRPVCEIEGEYNLNKLGTYKLKYKATDSSNNKTIIDFNLNVIEESDIEETKTDFKNIYNNYKKSNTLLGVDISSWQKDIDFKQIKDNGVSFVMIRLGYQESINGKLVLDDNFKNNIKEALKYNLDVGVYFYSKASSIKEAIEQADFVYKNIKNYSIKLPVAFDWEIYSSFNSLNISIRDLNSIADMFQKKIKGYGYDSMLYGSKNYLEKIWDMKNYYTWLAHYTKKTDYKDKYLMWQICNDGIIYGINGYVDIDILYKNSL